MDGEVLTLDEILVHPAAECFRLMHDDELQSLAADIAEHGLRDPITLGRVTGEDVGIVDGRNRYRACALAGVEPHFVTVEFRDDDEIRAFVVSRSERRNVTKGEHAMGIALAYPKAEMGRGAKDEAVKSAETADISMRRVQEARQVLRSSSDKARAVRDGTLKLDKALEEVRQAQADLESDETKLRQLRSDAPDLADLVTEERLTLAEAYSIYEKRIDDAKRAEQAKRDTLIRLTDSAFRGVTAWAVEDFSDAVWQRLNDPEFYTALTERMRIDPGRENLRDLKTGLAALLRLIKELSP